MTPLLRSIICWVVAPMFWASSALAQPTIRALSPSANASTVSRSSSVTVTCNQPLNVASTAGLQVYSSLRGGQRIGASGNTSITDNTLSFLPSAYDWQPGETVQVSVTNRITATDGQMLAAPRVFQFTTATGGTGRGRLIPPAANPDPAVGASPGSVALGDVDGDSDLDVVTANINNSVSVRLNEGLHSGNFVSPATGAELAVGSNPLQVLLADVDGDGDLDLLVLNANYGLDGNVSVRLNNGQGTFTPSAITPSVGLSYNPGKMAVGDIDGDGDLDLLVGTRGSTINVRINSGLNSGSFTPSAAMPDVQVYSSPACVALGDLDNDGDLDLVATNNDYSYVSVLLNRGLHSGTFPSVSSTPSVGTYPTSLALGDLDGDGDLDLLVGSGSGTNTASVLLNNGLHSASFVAGPGDVYADVSPIHVALGDLDADGDLDAVTANTSSNNVSVRFNGGLKEFQFGGYDSDFNFSVAGRPAALALGDVDGDGDLDVVTANSFPGGTISVRLNQTGPAPTVPPTLTAFTPAVGPVGTVVTLIGTGLASVTAVNFNGTPAPNFTVVSATSLTVTVPHGTSTGPITITSPSGTATSSTSFTIQRPGFSVSSLTPNRNQANAPLASVVAATFSQSVSNSTASRESLRVFSAQRGGKLEGTTTVSGSTLRFTPTVAYKPGETIFATITRDARSTTDSGLLNPHVHQFTTATGGTGRGYYRPDSSVGAGAYPSSVAVGDVDGDGDLDLVVANERGSSVSVRLNGGDATGSTTGLYSGSHQTSVSAGPRTVVLADVDNDGDLDLLAGCEGVSGGMLSVRLNGGDATGSNTGLFSDGYNVAINSGPLNLTLGDIDGDGDLDVVTADRYINFISVLRNSNGIFSPSNRIPAGRRPTSVVLGDVDGDGDLDLLFSNSEDGSVSVRMNGGDATGSNTGNFSGSQSLSLGHAPTSLVLGDLDGDGDLDLVVGNSHESATQVNVRLNGGDASGSNTGLFSDGFDVNVGGPAPSIALGDVDADGDLDLFTLHSGYDGYVRVYLNGGTSGTNTNAFPLFRQVQVGITPQGLALGDVDGDGDLDLLTANQGDNEVGICLNTDGGGVLTSSTRSVCIGSNTGTLTLSNAGGDVLNYQADTGTGYQNLSGSARTLTFTNLTVTTTFRAVVRNGYNQTVYSTPVTMRWSGKSGQKRVLSF